MATTYENWLREKTSDFGTAGPGAKIGLISTDKTKAIRNYYVSEKQLQHSLWAAYYSEVDEINSVDDLKNISSLFSTALNTPRSYFGYTYNSSDTNITPYTGLNRGTNLSIGGPHREKFFKKIYTEYIIPYYKTNIEDDPGWETETKELVKRWINDSSNWPLMQERLGMFGDSDENVTVTGFFASGNPMVVDPDNFFAELYSGQGRADLISELGFNKEIEKVVESSLFFTTERQNIAVLEKAIKEGREEAIDLIRGASGFDELTEEQKLDFRQCALATSLLHNKKIYGTTVNVSNYFQDPSSKSPLYSSDYKGVDASNYRVYPVIPDANFIDPNSLLNTCLISRNTKNVMVSTKKGKDPPNDMYKGLFWVYSSGSNGELKELKIPTSKDEEGGTNGKLRAKYSNALRIYNNPEKTPEEKQAEINSKFPGQKLTKEDIQLKYNEALQAYRERPQATKDAWYYLESTTIKYDGTNPSTARNDVTVNLVFKLGNLSALNSVIIDASAMERSSLNDTIQFRLMDLITLPITRKTETEGKNGGFITNEYSPDYSRIRLKVKAAGDDESNLILDLSTIDHQISRDSGDGMVTLTINYRGYFESVLNMPYNDALASNKMIEERNSISKQMEKIVSEGAKCDIKTIRQAMRMQQAYASRQNRKSSASSIISRLATRGNIHTYEFSERGLASLDSYVNPEKDNYVETISFGNSGSFKKDAESLERELREKEKNKDAIKKARNLLKNSFFFLGDLLHAVGDCLYKSDSAEHREELAGMNLRFMVGTVYVPNPKDVSGAPIVINPCSIPIDLAFFVEWFNSSIAKKGLNYYPVGTFIRDLVERVINGIIYETCFALLLPDETPPVLRVQTFTTTNQSWFKKQNDKLLVPDFYPLEYNAKGWFWPKDPEANGYDDQALKLLMHKNATIHDVVGKGALTGERDVVAYHYCTIYQQSPSFFRQIQENSQNFLRDDPYVPSIFYGMGNENYNFLNNVSFSKTDSPHLREARYFNTNYGSLSLLSNVYDLSFSFVGRVGNTLLYPGTIINFILLDWSGESFSKHPVESITYSNGSSDYTAFGESNPHKQGKMANIMGLGGYFIVKSVEYVLGEVSKEFEIKVTTKFLGNDGNKPPGRESEKDKKITESKDCIEAFNSIAKRANELFEAGNDDEIFVKKQIVSEDNSKSSNTEKVTEDNSDNPSTQRVSEAPGEADTTEASDLASFVSNGGLSGYQLVSPADYTVADANSDVTRSYGHWKVELEEVLKEAPKGEALIMSTDVSGLFFYVSTTGDVPTVDMKQGKRKKPSADSDGGSQ